MQIKFTLGAFEEPEAYAKVRAIIDVLSGQAQAVRAGGDVVADAVAQAFGEQPDGSVVEFGKQPLPDGVHFTAHNEVTGPLAPPAPPAPPAADAAPSPTAPEATTGSSAAPAAPPVPPAPPAAATQPPAPVGEVDKNGLPWDERIHSGNRAKVADGSWRMRRNVDPTKVAQVEAELRGLRQTGPLVVGEGILAPPPPVANPLDNLKPEAAPPLPPAAPELTFGMVAKRVTAKLTLGELTTAELTKRLAELGFPDGLHTINSRPDMWLTVLKTLGA